VARRALFVKRALALAPVLVVGACSLTTDLDGFTGGTHDAGTGRVTTPPGSDAAVVDARVEDGRAPTDGGAEAGAPPTCPDEPVAVCEEFDSDEKKNAWTVTQLNGASIAPATAPWGEHGLVVTTPKTASGDAPVAFWEKKFEKTVSKMTLDVDLQYDQIPINSGEFHNTFAVRVDHGTTYNIIYLTIGAGASGWAVQDFPSHDGDLDYRVVPVSPNERHHAHFDIEVGGRSRFAVDGVTQADNPTPAYFLAGEPTLYLGVTVYGVPSTEMTMGFAHLVFTAE
jgi:hypothetical protein